MQKTGQRIQNYVYMSETGLFALIKSVIMQRI